MLPSWQRVGKWGKRLSLLLSTEGMFIAQPPGSSDFMFYCGHKAGQ